VAFSDRAGDFVGLKVKDRVLLDDVLARLTASAGITIEDHRVNRRTIHELTLPRRAGLLAPRIPLPGTAGGAPNAGAEDGSNPAPAVLGIMSRLRTRLYWIDDGDYLYFSGLPQTLMDRDALGADTDIGSWLDDNQRVDLSTSLVAATGTVAKLPRLIYQGYVGVMQSLADMAEVDYDLWSMPTARQLGLPERGTLGLSFNLGEPYVSLELTFESNPGEILFAGGGVAGVALAGVMAAIALPAYQDYTIRAQVSEGLNLSAAAKFAVANTWTDTGAIPRDRAAAGMSAAGSDTQGKYVDGVDVDNGVIVIRFGNDANDRISGQTLTLVPYAGSDGVVVWVCGYARELPGTELIAGPTAATTNVASQYLPSACRR
jgi:Tfp pilus assembly major pilin PilA